MEVLERIYENYSEEDRTTLIRAYRYAEKAHENQKRASGEPYFLHPCAVASILIDLGLDCPSVAAAFLHDVIEDTPVTDEEVEKEFGAEILTLVQGVTKLDKLSFKSREEEDAENFRKIFVAMAKDIRVIIIKLADRLHNMRSLNFLSHERQQRISKETLEIFAPLAGRLGISQIKCELEDLCLKYLEPEQFEYLVTNINQKLYERQNFVNSVVEQIAQILKECNIEGEVFGRPKHFYSIYKKMKTKNLTLDQVYDLSAVRVLVNDKAECYTVLGKIHDTWKPLPGRIKDYISTPKPNNYQSLHTTVVTNFGQPFEIQIRTFDMHKQAEYGIAAHWKYKENRTTDNKDNKSFDQKLDWIREALSWQTGLKDSQEFIESLKTDLYNAELLVFTPMGKVISLPIGSTPVDFAYAIHSEVGNKCVGAKVNGKLVSLDTVLSTGDVVEITTSPTSKGPSWDWLKFIKSNGARAKIKAFFKNSMKEENIRVGRDMLEEEAKRRGYSFSELCTEQAFKRISEKFSFTSQDEMFASVGYGAVRDQQIITKLIDYYRKEVPKPLVPNENGNNANSSSSVTIKGQSGMLVRFAHCCSPIPGDDIIGFVSRGRGLIVHRKDCPNVRKCEADRMQEVEWANTERASFSAVIRIIAKDQGYIMSVVSSIISSMHLSITSINGRFDKNKDAIVELGVKLYNKEHTEELITKIKNNEKIIDVYRITTI